MSLAVAQTAVPGCVYAVAWVRLARSACRTPRDMHWGKFLLGVEPHERRVLALSFLYFFALLAGYYVLRPVRDAMGASADVAAVFTPAVVDWFTARGIALRDITLQVLYTVVFLVMLLLQPLYGAMVSRYRRRVFLPFVYLFFISCLVGFYLAFDGEMPGRGAAFFVFAAVFNLFAVAVFWSFMADVYVDDQAKRLYGTIAAGGTLGGLTGPALTTYLVGQVGVANLLLVSAGFLSVCLVCTLALIPDARRREGVTGQRQETPIGGSAWAGLVMVWRNPLLRALALLVFFGVGLGTLLYNQQAVILRQTAGFDAAYATRFYSLIDNYVNWTALVVQFLLTRRLMMRYGVAPLLLIPAAFSVIGYSILAASPLPIFVLIQQVISRASEFSLIKPGRESLFTRVDRETRYKANAAIETAVYRGGDLFFGWVHRALTLLGSHAVFGFGVLVALGFSATAWKVVKEQRRLPSSGGSA